MLANTLAMVDASGWKASVRLAFSDSLVTALLGLQDQFEVPLVVVAIRAPASDRAERAETAIPPLAMSTTPVAPRPVVFPLVIETQAAGDLDQSDVGSWREAAAKVGSPATTRTIAAPEQTSNEIIESLILRRGSTRMMRRQTVPLEVLRWVMSIATRPIPGDFAASEATLLNYHLAVYDVEATESGFYEWSGGELRMSRAEDSATVRAETQPLIAFWGDDAAYSLYECADLDELLPALGARGYRAAQVEAGIVAGRVNLAAFSLGYGSTPLTVRDRFVADVFGTKANFMLTMVVGTPGYSNVSGGKPGKPVELSGLEGLIDRLIDHIRKSRDP